LYDRTHRVLYDAGINEIFAGELANERVLTIALRSYPQPPVCSHLAVAKLLQRVGAAEDCATSKVLIGLAVPRGVEPPTFGLGNRCSILLSYGTIRLNYKQFWIAASLPAFCRPSPSE
jgi:hypothetical protein